MLNRNRHCSVSGCKIGSDKHPDVSFFKLPLDYERRMKWLRLIDREDLAEEFYMNSQICEVHFERSYVRAQSDRKSLHRSAQPSLQLPRTRYRHRAAQTAQRARGSQTAARAHAAAQTDARTELSERGEFLQLCALLLPKELAEEVHRKITPAKDDHCAVAVSGGSRVAKVYKVLKTYYNKRTVKGRLPV